MKDIGDDAPPPSHEDRTTPSEPPAAPDRAPEADRRPGAFALWRRGVAADFAAALLKPRLLAAAGLLAALFALTGPFDTDLRLALIPRAAYWTAAVAMAWTLAIAHVTVVSSLLPARWPEFARALLGAVACAPAIAGAIAILNTLVFGEAYAALDLGRGMALTAGMAVAVTLLVRLVGTPPLAAPSAFAPPRPPAPKLLRRLPPERRGAILRLSMHDHYVEVVTDRGSELVLLRLGDAAEEAWPTEGAQVHRSHWVARAAVTEARREGGAWKLLLSDGFEAPVSRTRAAELAKAGWLD
ncbi:MAG: LytTR family DNA-binding domain-containing protein [Pseudomonadota bacterium]